MFKNISAPFSGAALALAVAGLASTSATFAAEKPAADKTDLVHCSGVNSCKGHNDCATATNACASQGSCKGHGYLAMPSKACADVGGKVADDWKGEVAKADLMHCTGVNACKGHNDCKTADNACAGKASCKGHGFVAMPAAACTNMGGK